MVCWVGLINLGSLGTLILVTISEWTWQITNHSTFFSYTAIVIYLVLSDYRNTVKYSLHSQPWLTQAITKLWMKFSASTYIKAVVSFEIIIISDMFIQVFSVLCNFKKRNKKCLCILTWHFLTRWLMRVSHNTNKMSKPK